MFGNSDPSIMLNITNLFKYKDNNMTPHDFLFWLEGYIEAITDQPNKDQWKKIKDQLAKVNKEDFEKKEYEKKNIEKIIPGNTGMSVPIWPAFPNASYSDSTSNNIFDNYQ
jgi:hypothetical protein